MSAIMKGGKNSLSMYRANILIFLLLLDASTIRLALLFRDTVVLFLLVDLCRKNLHYFIR